jgi:N-acetylmuramoyl-L-alanine amidase
MMKAITFLQTLLILILPLGLSGFNFLLSFSTPPDTTLEHSHCFHDEEGSCFFGAMYQIEGKGIKDSRIAKKDYKIKTVVIDPGHGGHDPGCLGGNSREKHLALAISLHLAKAMKTQYPNIEVILTRDKDVFIPLHERAAIANRKQADLFMSIHCNYMPGSKATHGSETYVMGLHTAEHNLDVAKRENAAILLEDNYEKNYDYDPNSNEGHILLSMFQNAYLEQSILFAEKVEHAFAEKKRKSRGVKQAGFVVLKETAMPSVLVETGFLSNKEEEAFLMKSEGQVLIAGAILNAFGEYKAIVEGGIQPQPANYTIPFDSRKEMTAKSTLPKPYVNTAPVEPDPPVISAPVYHILTEDGETKESINIQFNVQLAASPRPIDTSDDKWRSTGYLIEVVNENNLYKYQARNFNSLQAAFEARLLLQTKGFPDAFIVPYKNGQRISMEQARKELGLP